MARSDARAAQFENPAAIFPRKITPCNPKWKRGIPGSHAMKFPSQLVVVRLWVVVATFSSKLIDSRPCRRSPTLISSPLRVRKYLQTSISEARLIAPPTRSMTTSHPAAVDDGS